MKITIETERDYDTLLLCLTSVSANETAITHGLYELKKGTKFRVEYDGNLKQIRGGSDE